MDATVVGIDVSKDWLDVYVLPNGEAFSVSRDAAGLEELAQRLKPSRLRRVSKERVASVSAAAASSFETCVREGRTHSSG